MLTRRIGLLTLSLAVTGVAAPPTHAQQVTAPAVIYQLQQGSSFQRGCFEPCSCPIWMAEQLTGFFQLTLVEHGPLFDTYDVTDVDWSVDLGSAEWHVSGSGMYQRGGEVAVLERLQLELSINGQPAQFFDSGWVGAGSAFPTIATSISQNGMYCYDTVFSIIANPLPVSTGSHYQLTADSSFTQGCFPPCLCPIMVERPLVGSFTLNPLLSTTSEWKIFEVRDVQLKTAPSPSSATAAITYTGSGTYRLYVQAGSDVVKQRLELNLLANGVSSVHFDSGLVNATTDFPSIDVAVSVNGMYCHDTVLRIAADPLPDKPTSHARQVIGGARP